MLVRRPAARALLRACGALLSAAAAAAVSLPAAAGAATVNISIYSAGPTNTANPDVLTVVAQDFNNQQLTSMTVHLYSGTTDVLDVTDMQYASGSPDFQTWTATAPITQADLAPGTYTMTVDAADAQETDAGLTTPSPLAFVYSTTITASSTQMSEAHQTTTISGKLTGITPGAGGNSSPVPLAGVPVMLFNQNTSTSEQIATTAADGTYQGTATPNQYDSYIVDVDPTATMGSSGVLLPLTINQDTSRLQSVTVTPADLTYGQTGTLTGTAQYKNGSTWTPLAGMTIMITVGSVQLTSVQTNDQGQFSSAMPTADGPAWSLLLTGDRFVTPAQASGTLTVQVPLTFHSFAAKLDSFGRLHASACLATTAPDYGAPATGLQIQYAKRPGGPWTSLGKLRRPSSFNLSCDASQESYFKGTLPVRLPNAYYRAVYPKTIHFDRAVSGTLHRWKYLTRITNFAASPRRVARNGFVSVSGRLWRHGKSWQPYANRKVMIVFRYKKVYYAYKHRLRTNSAGRFSGRFRAYVSAPWFAQYNGDKTHFASASARIKITVTSGGTGRRVPWAAAGLPGTARWQTLLRLARSAAALSLRL